MEKKEGFWRRIGEAEKLISSRSGGKRQEEGDTGQKKIENLHPVIIGTTHNLY